MASAIGIKILFFDAVLGSRLGAEKIESVYDFEENAKQFKRPLSHQEIGCYISHKQLWEKIATSYEPAAVVLEDDAIIEGDLAGLIDELAAIDIERVYVKIDGPIRSALDVNVLKIGNYKLERTRCVAPRTTGYILGRSAARKLCKYQKRFFRPVDIDLKHHWEHGVPILTTSPQLVREVHPKGFGSSIEGSRRVQKPTASTVRFWKNLTYQARYKWACYTHPLATAATFSKEKHSDYA